MLENKQSRALERGRTLKAAALAATFLAVMANGATAADATKDVIKTISFYDESGNNLDAGMTVTIDGGYYVVEQGTQSLQGYMGEGFKAGHQGAFLYIADNSAGEPDTWVIQYPFSNGGKWWLYETDDGITQVLTSYGSYQVGAAR